MTGTPAEGLAQHRDTPSPELVMRALREFDTLPTLRITIDQAMRLLDADRASCRAALEALCKAHIITLDDDAQYRRAE